MPLYFLNHQRHPSSGAQAENRIPVHKGNTVCGQASAHGKRFFLDSVLGGSPSPEKQQRVCPCLSSARLQPQDRTESPVRKDGTVSVTTEISSCLLSWWRENPTSHFSCWGSVEELDVSWKVHKILLLQNIWLWCADKAVWPHGHFYPSLGLSGMDDL